MCFERSLALSNSNSSSTTLGRGPAEVRGMGGTSNRVFIGISYAVFISRSCADFGNAPRLPRIDRAVSVSRGNQTVSAIALQIQSAHLVNRRLHVASRGGARVGDFGRQVHACDRAIRVNV